MSSKAFKAYKKQGSEFITLVGFNGDSITTKNQNTARDFALYCISQLNAHEIRQAHTSSQRERNAGAAGVSPASFATVPAGPALSAC